MSKEPKKQSDSSRQIKTMEESVSKYKTPTEISNEVIDLRNLIASQELEIKSLEETLKNKQKQIFALEDQISAHNSPIERISDDLDSIANYQLERLLLKARESELTLEEARKLEIYSKIKNQRKKDSDVEPSYRKLNKTSDPNELLQIANNKINDEIE